MGYDKRWWMDSLESVCVVKCLIPPGLHKQRDLK